MRISDWSSDVCSSDLATNGQALTLAEVEKEQPLVPTSSPRERSERSDRPERSGDRERRAPVPLAEGRARCRTPLGARDGRSAERRVGKEGGSTCRSRGSPYD